VTNPSAADGPRKPAKYAFYQSRHRNIIISFLCIVLLPVAAIAFYLWVIAEDQYASTVAFSVHTEKQANPLEALSGLTGFSGSSSNDMDVLYKFVQSQKLISELDDRIDLRAMWSKPKQDVYFRFKDDATIEDLMSYWNRMVKRNYDKSAGLLELRVLAFDPNDAQLIAQTILDMSSDMINDLSAIAREDTLNYAQRDLKNSENRLLDAREAITTFRNDNLLIDPKVDFEVQASVIGRLQEQLATEMVELDVILDSSRDSDPRVENIRSRIQVIEARIREEKSKIGVADGTQGGMALVSLVGEYERLVVTREFAEQAYIAALSNYDATRSEVDRKSRYLGAYILPTLAERSQFPERGVINLLLGVFLLLGWSVSVLATYAIRDRK
jgi:capsular polysaccharide transport system permease protein